MIVSMLLVLVLFSQKFQIKNKNYFPVTQSLATTVLFGGFYGPAVSVQNMGVKILQKPFLDMKDLPNLPRT
jgi:hypothetical protein